MRHIRIGFLLLCAVSGFAMSQAGSIDSISPTAGRKGQTVTIHGRGFGALNVQIKVGGVPAVVLSAYGDRATFRIPDGVQRGHTQVVATNPGFQSGSIDFLMLEGILLPGDPAAPALTAIFTVPPVAAPLEDLLGNLFLTRLDLVLSDDATVGQLNAALIATEAGIVSMKAGTPFLTIAVPRTDVAGLKQSLTTLNAAAGIAHAALAYQPATQSLPQQISTFVDQQLLPTRFPAAWNASALAVDPITLKCKKSLVPVLVGDDFVQPLPSDYADFGTQLPNFHLVPGTDPGSTTHGYNVTTVLAALYDNQKLTGANPFSQCLDITGVQIDGLDVFQTTDRLIANFPASSPFVLNFSNGYSGPDPDCEPYTAGTNVESCLFDPPPADPENSLDTITPPLDRAYAGAYWKQQSLPYWQDFFAAASAGNTRDELVGKAYKGLIESAFNSPLTVAAISDTLFGFAGNPGFWSPAINDPKLPSFTADSTDLSVFQTKLKNLGLDRVGPENNELIVGSTGPGNDFSQLVLSPFSNNGSDVVAVGDAIQGYGSPGIIRGTSFTAPQVAGLASYLWLLSDDLRNNPNAVAFTRQAILANTRNTAVGKIIDAYATVLSLDAAGTPTPLLAPIRLALLDVNGDGVFDEQDVQLFLNHYLDGSGNPIANPSDRDYSRFDLNGDGFTGGGNPEMFDLDRAGSVQYGTATYTDITQEIEGQTVTFQENKLTDLQILCYYAYSPMYTGDTAARTNLLRRCAGTTVKVTPATPSVAVGSTQQFSAQVLGPQDPRVTWSVDGTAGGSTSAGTIGTDGLYTAPSSPGTHTVRATSVADPTAFGEATVTVTAGTSAGVSIGTGLQNGNGPLVFQAFLIFTDSNGAQTITRFDWPINDVGGLMAKVNTLVAGVSRFSGYSIAIGPTPAPVSFTVNLSVPAGSINIGGTSCHTTYNITAGDVDSLNLAPQCNSAVTANVHDVNSTAEIAPDHSTVTLTAHNIGLGQGHAGALFVGCAFSFGCFTVQSSTVNVQAAAMGQFSVTASDSSIKVSGQIQPWNVSFQCGTNGSDAGCFPGIFLQGNNNTQLIANLSGNVSFFLLDNNTWSSPPQISIGDEVIPRDFRTTNLGLVSITNNRGLLLGGISGLNSITGNLRITGNFGFSDAQATAFANGRSVQGGVEIGQNQ